MCYTAPEVFSYERNMDFLECRTSSILQQSDSFNSLDLQHKPPLPRPKKIHTHQTRNQTRKRLTAQHHIDGLLLQKSPRDLLPIPQSPDTVPTGEIRKMAILVVCRR